MFEQIEPLFPFMVVAYTMWATPGPNNMMLTYSGAKFGIKATMPHIFGIVFGTFVLNTLAILGLKPLINQWPQLLLVLKVLGSLWLLKIGWKMIHAQKMGNNAAEQKPMTFIAATLFQFANPKAISATLALVSLVIIAIERQASLIWWVLIFIPPMSLLAIMPWLVAGQSIRRFLSSPLRWTIFAWTTGGLTAASALLIWF